MLPVEKGLVNLRATYSNSNQSASVKQIVKAIDELKGSTDWRSKDSSKKDLSINSKRKHLEHLTRVTCILPRGSEDRLISVILDNGAPGASVFYGKECGNQAKELNQGIQLTNEKAIIEMTLSNDIVQPIIEKIKHESDQYKLSNTVIYTHTVDRAFTYIGD